MNTVMQIEEIEPGWVVTSTKTTIIPDVELCVYSEMDGCQDATLRLGKAEINLKWNEELAADLANIDELEAIELIALLAAHSQQY